jgi:Protein of unknown function (DUF1566)/Secretion system C-terminal sorting domain
MRVTTLKRHTVIILSVLFAFLLAGSSFADGDYPIVDTGQDHCYDTQNQMADPSPGQAFYGQDAQYTGLQFSFTDNGDGTVTDNITLLMWQQTPALYDKMSWDEAIAGADTFSLAGHDDWRLPTMKELYSLIDFRGASPSYEPYIDTTFFDFRWGETGLGERPIDTQYWSSNEYLGTVFENQVSASFGVNFGDGRIKGYPNGDPDGPPGSGMNAFVRYVRDNPDYGTNDFVDNGDGTITDRATGLTWLQTDNGNTYNWEEALSYVESLEFAEQDDWRLPNAKELHSIVDYGRAPDAVDPEQQGPAIADIFTLTDESAWMWTGTTLRETPVFVGEGKQAVYVCFGRATGIYNNQPVDVHGAGAQRGDPKEGNPDDYPNGFGPQNDEIRIYNYVMPVRGGSANLNLTGVETEVGANGGTISYKARLLTAIDDSFNGADYWTTVITPNGNSIGPLSQQSLNVPAYANMAVGPIEVSVPSFAPAGEYIHQGFIGYYPYPLLQSSFVFQKSEIGSNMDPVDSWSETGWDVNNEDITGRNANSVLPTQFEVGQAYPNPFNPTVNVSVRLPENGELSITLINVVGQEVAQINGDYSAGVHLLQLNASAQASGMYLLRINYENYTSHQKVTLMK